MLERSSSQAFAARATPVVNCATALAFMVAIPSVSSATVFPTGFAGPSLEPGMVESGTAGTSYTVGGGTLVLSQAAGEGNGQVTVSLVSPVTGDFSLAVTVSAGSLGRADLGIVLGTADWSHTLADVFINDLGQSVNGNIFQPDFAGAFLPNTTQTMTLEITRTGDTISDIYNTGSGPVVINSGQDPSLADPVTVSLFLLEAAGDTGAHQGAFGDFDIVSLDGDALPGATVPEPSSAAVLGFGMVAIGGATAFARRKAARSQIPLITR